MPKAHKNREATHARLVGVPRATLLPQGTVQPAAAEAPDVVEYPGSNATKAEWVEYAALALGEDLAHLTKRQIIDVVESAE